MSAAGHTHAHDRGHSHGLVHDSIKRSREGVRAVLLALLILGVTALAQVAVFVASGSVALLADVIHNFGDAATALPLGIAFALRTRAGRRIDSPALVADGNHARADAYVSLAVVASAAVVALGLQVADPVIGLAITVVILRITWASWQTVGGQEHP